MQGFVANSHFVVLLYGLGLTCENNHPKGPKDPIIRYSGLG